MPLPMGWRLPNIKFLCSSWHFTSFPAKTILVNWAQTCCEGEGIENMSFTCAPLAPWE